MSTIQAPAHSRHLRATAATLAVILGDENGVPADPGTVTIGVTKADGTEVVASGTATTDDDANTLGRRYYALTASQTASLDRLSATWTVSGVTVASTVHEIVGGYWFTIAELAGMPGVASALGKVPADTSAATSTTELVRLRREVEELLEWATGVAWVPRYAYESLDSPGAPVLQTSWPRVRTLRSLSLDGTAQTTSDYVVDEWGAVRDKDGGTISATNYRGVVVGYEHGYDRPPEPLKRAALQCAAARLMAERTSYTSMRTASVSVDGMVTQFARIDPDHPTGIPEVDGIVRAYSHRTPGMA